MSSANDESSGKDERDMLIGFEGLKRFEAQRRSYFQLKLEKLELTHKSLHKLMQASIFETQKLYRLVAGAAKANGQMAQGMAKLSLTGDKDTLIQSLERSHENIKSKMSQTEGFGPLIETIKELDTMLETKEVGLQKQGKKILDALKGTEGLIIESYGKSKGIFSTKSIWLLFRYHIFLISVDRD